MSIRPQQYSPSLAAGQAIRLERAARRRDVAARRPQQASREAVAAILTDPPPCVATLEVRLLLTWAHRTGNHHAERWARRAGISGLRQIGELTTRQREALAADLRGCSGSR